MHKWDFRNTYYLIGVIDRAISFWLLFFMVLWLLKKKTLLLQRRKYFYGHICAASFRSMTFSTEMVSAEVTY